MTTLAAGSRHKFRRYDLDGAAVWFHPATGTNVRVDAPATAHLRRQVPRVVMFGITNACNLACTYCSRDAGRPSAWTVATAAELLEDLARAGVLEIAFGGGEPFAFSGFAPLLERLQASTALALNVTTNGTLLTPALLDRVAPLLGQLRLSLHDSADWRAAARRLASSSVRWGANVLIDDAAVAGLPDLLAELGALGATDASLLAYVGPDRARHPSTAALARCAAIVRASVLPCRVSVCFGRRLGVDLPLADLDATGDCGAGADFVTITPDRRLSACSFQDDGLPIVDAADVLRRWRQDRGTLAAASPRAGCARRERQVLVGSHAEAPALRVWQAFSGNNSSECHLVARFREAADAERLLAQLTGLPLDTEGYFRESPRKLLAPWYEFFAKTGMTVAERRNDDMGYRFEPPESLGVFGRTLVAHHDYTLGNFDELAALAWREGAECRHEAGSVLFAVRTANAAAAAQFAAKPLPVPDPELASNWHVVSHAEFAVGIPRGGGLGCALACVSDFRQALAGGPNALTLEVAPLSCHSGAPDLARAMTRLVVDVPLRSRLQLDFGWRRAADADRFAATIDDHAAICVGQHVLIDAIDRKRRIALRACAAGAKASILEAERLDLHGGWTLPERITHAPVATERHALATVTRHGRLALDVDSAVAAITASLQPRLRSSLQAEFDLTIAFDEARGQLGSVLSTTNPMVAWPIVEAVAQELDLEVWHRIVEPDHLLLTIQRLLADLRRRR